MTKNARTTRLAFLGSNDLRGEITPAGGEAGAMGSFHPRGEMTRRGVNRIRRILAVCAAAFFLCACASAGQGTQNSNAAGAEEGTESMNGSESASGASATAAASLPVNTPATEINAWGDSITEGYGSDGDTYPEVLERLTGIPVRNLGIGGEDSREILARSIRYGRQEEDILVIQMGDNGGWRSLDELIEQYKTLIREAGTEQYIIISSTDDPDDFEQVWGYTRNKIGLDDTPYEAKYRDAFGDHLLIGRKYLIEHGLEINGLTETDEDRMRAEKGGISLQLRNPEIDNTHLNEYGYTALAYGVYDTGKMLGYW